MHEFSIASEIVRHVLENAEKSGAREVCAISLEIGELTLVNVDQVIYWVRMLFQGTMAEGAEVRVKTIKAAVRCPSCGYRGRDVPHGQEIFQHSLPPLCCPKCGQSNVKVEKGHECVLRRIQAVR